jgi:D-alanyl-D-alanine dipeptidase
MENNNFVKYKDLLTIKEFDEEANKDGFVFLPLEDEFVVGIYKKGRNMLEYSKQVPVRNNVYLKLIEVAKNAKKINSNYKMVVVYGYRDLNKQIKYFNEIYEESKDMFDNQLDLYEYIHEKIAVPEVSGHPTGGAVDILIYDSEKEEYLDYGSEILDYSSNECYYHNDRISKEAMKNREVLRKLMMDEGFAPYDGEWWHFSYGDKEWAFYYKKGKALYNQIIKEEVFKN